MNQREIDAAAKRLLGKRPSTEEDMLASLGMRVTSAEIDAALGVAQAALGLDNLQFTVVCLMRAAAYFGDPPEAGSGRSAPCSSSRIAQASGFRN